MSTTREQFDAAKADLQSAMDNPRTDDKTLEKKAAKLRQHTELMKAHLLDVQMSKPDPNDPYLGALAEIVTGPGSTGWTSAPITTRSTGWGDALVKSASPDDTEFKSLVPSGSVTVPSLLPGITRHPDRPRSVLEVVPSTRLEGTDQFSFLRETVRTHNADVVAVGALKPTSVYSLERVDETAKTIAHLSEPIPRQWLADASLLRQYVEGALRDGVELAVEDEIINGPGTGEHFLGIDDTPNIQTQAFAFSITHTARKAITKLEDERINGGTFVFTPADWETLELSAESTGHYMLGDQLPVNRAGRRLWGLPVVTSSAVDAGKGFLVDFEGSTRLWEREAVRIDWSENTYDPDALGEGDGATDFARNLVRYQTEGRFGFAVTRPKGVVEIDTAA